MKTEKKMLLKKIQILIWFRKKDKYILCIVCILCTRTITVLDVQQWEMKTRAQTQIETSQCNTTHNSHARACAHAQIETSQYKLTYTSHACVCARTQIETSKCKVTYNST